MATYAHFSIVENGFCLDVSAEPYGDGIAVYSVGHDEIVKNWMRDPNRLNRALPMPGFEKEFKRIVIDYYNRIND